MDDFRNTHEMLSLDFRGEMIGPEDERFDDARGIWNATIDRRPALIIQCKDAGDVQTAVRLAIARDLPIAIRGG